MDKTIIELIDSTIKFVWEYDISMDYNNHWLLREDTLKNDLYHHLRKHLDNVFQENDIKIFTEFGTGMFSGTKNRPDMIIAKIDKTKVKKFPLNKCISEYLCVIEIKYKNGYNGSKDILDDYEKLKDYIETPDIKCSRYYMATIWEYKDKPVTWARKNAAWAKGKLTELNASYCGKNGEMKFYICNH